jgi:hypothetical protein
MQPRVSQQLRDEERLCISWRKARFLHAGYLSVTTLFCVKESLTPVRERSLQQHDAGIHTRETGGNVAEIRIEEKKRGAPWLLILLLLVVAAIIGWWLWSHRSAGSDTTSTPSGMVADSTAAKKNP